MVIAEALAGLALVKSAVKGVKEVIATCEDIGGIAHHLEDLFHGASHVDEAIKNKTPKVAPWKKFMQERIGVQMEEPDGNSIPEVAALVIQKKQIEQEMKKMQTLLNKRFGFDTWKTILELRDQRILEQKERNKKAREAAKRKAKASSVMWHKVFMETGKILVVIAVVGGLYLYLSWAYNS